MDSETFIYLLPFIGMGVILYITAYQKQRKKEKVQKIQDELKNCVEYFEYSQTLKIHKRIPQLKEILRMEKLKANQYKYVEGKLVYTSATVGGITTGGVHKQGDYYHASEYDTGKYVVLYSRYDYVNERMEDLEVKRISLPPELYDEVKSSCIAEYFNGHHIQIVEDTPSSDKEIAALMMAGLRDKAISLISYEKSLGYPDEYKCREILNWVFGK